MRIDNVKFFVLSEYAKQKKNDNTSGITASEVAQALNIQRSNASLELNELFNLGILGKSNTRPVRFFPIEESIDISNSTSSTPSEKMILKDTPKDIFTLTVEKNPSLHSAFSYAKAAVSYPPHGLNILVTGETGVGKSYFAEKIWQYACENNCLGSQGKTIPFITFSCAEYADNPQLLLSQLFGHAKGAFTGATEAKKGIVEEANNGILFLDEIHRLPSTGQELLFMLIDKGILRRMGDKEDRKINVMIICATTEDINTVLLKTFTRRIPVVINIPSLAERTSDEKLNLIKSFLEIESERVNAPIWISGKALNFLTRFQPTGNVGELRNIINLCCAKGYLHYISQHNQLNEDYNDFIKINFYDLPQKIYQEVDITLPSNLSIKNILTDGLLVSSKEDISNNIKVIDEKYSLNLYKYIDQRINSYLNLNIDNEEIPDRVSRDLESYYDNAINRLNTTEEDTKLIDGIIPSLYKNIASDIIHFASLKLQRVYSKSITIALAMHIRQFINRSNNGEIIYNPNLDKICLMHPEEMKILKELQQTITNQIGVNVTDDELGFWAMFLSQKESTKDTVPKIGLIVTAHGNSIAKSMAQFANNFISTNRVHSLDAPINKSVWDVFDELCTLITNIDEGKGVLILADMGSFATIEDKLIEKTGIPCRIIPSTSSILVLESAKVVLSSDESLDNIYRMVWHDYYQLISSQFKESSSKNHNLTNTISAESVPDTMKNTVITVCSTGFGSAEILKDIITKEIVNENTNIEVISLSITQNIQRIADELGNHLKLIVGGINPHIKNVPFLGAEYVLTQKGIQTIKNLLNVSEITVNAKKELNKEDEENIFEMIEKRCEYFTPSLDSELAMNLARELCKRIEREIAPSNPQKNYYVNITLHFLQMLERLKNNQSESLSTWSESLIVKNHDLYSKLKLILNEICSPLQLQIPKSEVSYYLYLV